MLRTNTSTFGRLCTGKMFENCYLSHVVHTIHCLQCTFYLALLSSEIAERKVFNTKCQYARFQISDETKFSNKLVLCKAL